MHFAKQAVTSVAILVCLSATAADYGGYSGKGGMAAYAIKPNVYEYHYDKGFTGPDAMGWNPNLQFAWSRIAAAKACGISVSTEKIIPLLIKKFEQDDLTHKMIGIEFHSAQIRANKKFCTDERIGEITAVVPQFESGNFPEKF